MKQAQSELTRYWSSTRMREGDAIATYPQRWINQPVNTTTPKIEPWNSGILGHVFLTLVSALWFTVTLPFRLIFWMIAWLGRLTAVLLGFSLMVLGIAFWAGPLFFIGIPLFVVGLVLTLRCLD